MAGTVEEIGHQEARHVSAGASCEALGIAAQRGIAGPGKRPHLLSNIHANTNHPRRRLNA